MKDFWKWLIGVNVLLVVLVAGIGYLGSRPVEKKIEYLPEGAIVAYEQYKGCKVPILSDGKGGTVRWIADVPWEKFDIREKMIMVLNRGAELTRKDLEEFINTYKPPSWTISMEGEDFTVTK